MAGLSLMARALVPAGDLQFLGFQGTPLAFKVNAYNDSPRLLWRVHEATNGGSQTFVTGLYSWSVSEVPPAQLGVGQRILTGWKFSACDGWGAREMLCGPAIDASSPVDSDIQLYLHDTYAVTTTRVDCSSLQSGRTAPFRGIRIAKSSVSGRYFGVFEDNGGASSFASEFTVSNGVATEVSDGFPVIDTDDSQREPTRFVKVVTGDGVTFYDPATKVTTTKTCTLPANLGFYGGSYSFCKSGSGGDYTLLGYDLTDPNSLVVLRTANDFDSAVEVTRITWAYSIVPMGIVAVGPSSFLVGVENQSGVGTRGVYQTTDGFATVSPWVDLTGTPSSTFLDSNFVVPLSSERRRVFGYASAGANLGEYAYFQSVLTDSPLARPVSTRRGFFDFLPGVSV